MTENLTEEVNKWINDRLKIYEERLKYFISLGKSEEEFLEDFLKMLKIMEYFRQNNLNQDCENIQNTKCEIHYNVYSVQNEERSYL